ncbi:MAG: 50S ribosomal protein L1 [Chlamydiae bacterium]|nr:50S ribosomal protein L1 [Chlamydiota bacterium]MBI3266651.1 50S ribosomal protein L1 [Chlamydiota bacterium]
MKKHSKRYEQAKKLVDENKVYSLSEAMALVKKFPATKFDETVHLAVKLGVDPKQSDQQVRGTVALPHGTGKKVRVLVFTKGEGAKLAKDAGADYVGFEDLIEKVNTGWCDFDVVVASPETMREVGKLGKVLGPKGLMPSPKTGTVTPDVEKAVREVKAGRVEFKMDKSGNLHLPIGKVSFGEKALTENLSSVLDALARSKPSTSKGEFMQSCTVSTAMGPGIRLQTKLEVTDET